MKVRTVLAIIAVSTTFVAYLDKPAHASETSDLTAAGFQVQAYRMCRDTASPVTLNAVAGSLYVMAATDTEVEAAQVGVDAFNNIILASNRETACAKVAAAFK